MGDYVGQRGPECVHHCMCILGKYFWTTVSSEYWPILKVMGNL